jgi:phosphocarrier protein FPr
MPAEENPALGLRGIRFALRHPELLRAQIRALLRVNTKLPIRILLPMVTSATEVRAVRALIEAERRELGGEHPAQVGAMIEVPVAAVSTDLLASEVDFFSLGTNDLTQYGAAADRGNPEVAPFLDGLHPGVLRLMAQAVGGARGWHRPLAVCGGMASDPRTAGLLIGLGVTELSVAPAVVPDIKAFIATLNAADCVGVAQQSLVLASAAEVRALLHSIWPVI